jgi:lysozyme family protein
MSVITYIPTIDRIIDKYEGGYGWNRSDPGGPTKYGITCFDLAEFMGQHMDSMARWAPIVQAMPRSTAETIYKNKYAKGIRYDDLPAGPDACMLDYGINSGNGRPLMVARAILGLKGGMAPMDQTLLDAIKKADPITFVNAMCAERLHFLQALRTWSEFGGGWGRRVADLKVYCTHLAQGGAAAAAPNAPDLTHTVTPKGIHTGDTAPGKTAGGAVGAGTAAVAAGFPWYYVVGIVVATIVAGVIYEAVSANKASTANNTVVLPPGVKLPTVPAVPAAA